MRDQVSHPYGTTYKITVLYILIGNPEGGDCFEDLDVDGRTILKLILKK
jgi:hypothetical protein